MSLKQLKKYIFYSILFIGLTALIYMGIKDIPTFQRDVQRRDIELQKLKEQLFDCETPAKEATCSNEVVEDIENKIKDLEKND